MPKTQTKKRIRILHVDDEADTLAVVKVILEKEGFEVISVNQGVDALGTLNMSGFDLLILDMMMPDMTGWDLYCRILKIKHDYKVIFLSILEMSNEKLKELKESGVNDYIKKPFDKKDFVERVKAVVNS